MKAIVLALASIFVSVAAHAANVVPDGLYVGSGTWNSFGPAGSASGVIDMEWEQDGDIGTNLGVLMVGTATVAQFSDLYEFVSSDANHYTLKRLVGGAYQTVGAGVMNIDSYETEFMQDTLVAKETGWVDGTTLTRVGTLTAPDGTVTFYRAVLTKQ